VTVLIREALLLDPEAAAPARGSLLVDGERILDVIPAGDKLPDDLESHPLSGRRLAPGLIDLHHHGELVYAGAGHVDAALRRTSAELARSGVTAFLATTVAWGPERVNSFMTQIEQSMTHAAWPGAEVLGVHLEGPWINAQAAGAQPRSAIRGYESVEDRKIVDRHGEVVRMVTLAPEVMGADTLLDDLTQRGIVASLGHSRAPGEVIDAAVTRGMTHVTHLFNAMGPVHHRDPGVAVWVLGEERLSCDLICDGVHVHPRIAAGAARLLGERMVLITDRITEPPTGDGSFGSGRVIDDGTALRLEDGRLAGSSLTMDRAVRNARSMLGRSEIESIAAATLRPARLLGIESERGTLRPGARADLVALDGAGHVEETWIGDRCVFSQQSASDGSAG
jgi:N-acetylglucosamine-6-phosphate deacetylase